MASNKWIKTDEISAIAQGWSMFTVDSGNSIIQKLDDPSAHDSWVEGMIEECPFNSDNQAIRFVRREANKGNKTAQKAIAIHDANIVAWRKWRNSH